MGPADGVWSIDQSSPFSDSDDLEAEVNPTNANNDLWLPPPPAPEDGGPLSAQEIPTLARAPAVVAEFVLGRPATAVALQQKGTLAGVC